MTRLNQMLAVRKDVNNLSNRAFTTAYQRIQKTPLLTGIIKTYRPNDDDDVEKLPGERQHVQIVANTQLHEATAAFKRMFSVSAQIDATNCVAAADIIVDGTTILVNVPATHLLWLEKQLTDLHTFVERMPILDSALEWTTDSGTGVSQTPPRETVRQKKVPYTLIKAPATDRHPAQVDVLYEDRNVGTWSTIHLSGGMRAGDVAVLLERVRNVREAVKRAREQANMTEVVAFDSSPILDYIIR